MGCIFEISVVNYTFFFIRNHFISNQVLDSLKFKTLLELHGESYETLEK